MPDAVKAAHYIQQLDDARCEENWDAVPELIRKVRKHAPERQCLTLTAQNEAAITKAGPKASRDELVGAESSTDLPKLHAAIQSEQAFPEDKFQAKVCVGWVHWALKEYDLALAGLPRNFHEEYTQLENFEGLSEWTKVCALKAAYLRANCLAREGQRDGALTAFESALPSLSGVWTTKNARQQLRYWAELFLTEYCMLAGQAIREGERQLSDPNCLACFRTWSAYWANTKGAPLAGGYGFKGSVPRRQVWSEYYYALSEILQQDLPYPTGYAAVNNESSARNQLRAELKKVETIYQGLLFSETKFPKADEQREEVEDFVYRAMQNWAILNGHGWKVMDLGAGGRESLSHGVLDTLYGAATKTYHSTAVLRHLFTVHLALAEFDLAFLSFDSYLALVKKGRARVQKTGHIEPALDDDATMLETISSCIAALCRYGGKEAAEKARGLAVELEELVKEISQTNPVAENGVPLRGTVSPSIFGLAWQSIGLAHAQWAHMTYDSDSRTQIQDKAIQCLRKSLSPEYGRGVDVTGVFALGVLLAEQRKLSVAIELVKTALLADTAVQENQDLHSGPYWRERSLIPLWHLLALMLSARQEYVMAARACEGAIEQFKDPTVLFGGKNLNGTYRSDHLNEAGIHDEKVMGDGLVDEMDDYEKESILEIKMTQLAILELVEGPAVAVNASTELLTLFPRLFGDVDQKLELVTEAKPPKSSAATLRSIRGSVFGSRSDKGSKPRGGLPNADSKMATINSRPTTTQTAHSAATAAPTVHVSQENGDPRSSRRSMRSASVKGRSESTKRRASLRKRSSSSRPRAMSSGGVSPTQNDGHIFFAPFDDIQLPQHFSFASRKTDALGLATLQHSTSHTSNGSAESRGEDLSGLAVKEVESVARLLPYVQFSQDHNKRKRKAILVGVWLTIAGFYRRAGLLGDAGKACAEAQKIVQTLEADISADTSGSLSARQAGWGQKKSVEELLADVWAEKGNLSLARERPYQARADFETALTYFPDHVAGIVGLSNILMDVYSEKLPPPPAVAGLEIVAAATGEEQALPIRQKSKDKYPELPWEPLGLTATKSKKGEATSSNPFAAVKEKKDPMTELVPPHKAKSLPLLDRLAARDRAYMLLSGLTKLGTGWNHSEAWFALARAYEESDQPEKAKDALWWCVELEDSMGAREWGCVGVGGYVL
ncbi:putative cargo-transport protein ypp1 [Podospora aff. communis PSN243]|uniref:Cargo-transport protein ypp1 n=1 Tax=Podospora aff. communis PSN243 TaxID=3040156 RepID=A0AAV9H8R9_9PEZI|nr:putative cargo-transport protein ypp1 [Podospora aff. communis PSN243]